MRKIVVVGVSIALLAGSNARAQIGDAGASVTAGIEELAPMLGQAVFAGPSVFVTAKGHARLPAPIADAYSVALEGKNASAVQATRERDAKVAQVLAAAKRAGVAVEESATSISLEVDTEAQQARIRAQAAQTRAGVQAGRAVALDLPPPDAPPPKVFIARANLRFRTSATANLAAFFDAIRAAGVDDIAHGLNGPANPFLPRFGETFGFGSVEALDDGIWNQAGAEALQKARNQAQALAAASGRTLGPAKSIIVLGRGADGEEATESLGVRFALGDSSR